MDRVVAALDYYQFLVLGAAAAELVEDPKSTFTAFCDELYPKRMLMDDYIHWVLHHKDPENIKALRARLHFICESAKLCGATSRHYRERQNDGKGADDATNWFTEKMDVLHFNVYHLHELGLRVEPDVIQKEVATDHEETDEAHSVKLALQRMAEVVEAKRAAFSTERLDGNSNSKFTLKVVEQQRGGVDAGDDGM